jgi:DNA-binding NarL/FixJ family response regulator
MKILMIDDHPMMCEAIMTMIRHLDADNTISLAGSIEQASQQLNNQFDTDLVILDLGLSDAHEFSGLITLKARFPDIPIVVMSADRQPHIILECLNLGAVGYIPKTSSKNVLINALRLVTSGGIYVPPEAVAHVEAELQTPLPLAGRDSRVALTLSGLGLTDRQQDVLKLILKGMPNKLICRQLALAEGTVKVHVSAVLRTLGAKNRTQAVVAASKLGLRLE